MAAVRRDLLEKAAGQQAAMGAQAARKVFVLARRWAGLLAGVNLGTREVDVADEIIIYSMYRLVLGAHRENRADRLAFLKGAREELCKLRREAWGGAASEPISFGADEAAEPGYLQRYGARRGEALTPEVFEQFKLSTGIGSSVLVGNGGNLASLVFYLSVHTVLSQRSPLTRAQVGSMLKLAQQCRLDVEKLVGCRAAARRLMPVSSAARAGLLR